MKKKFKKIYIEITNICNLNCSFCKRTTLPKKEMTIEEFEHILKKIDKYTDYIYLHVQGEPLLHSKLKEILDICNKYNKQVNITTNGTLIKEKIDILKSSNIRQLNISLHAYNGKENYFKDIFTSINKLKNTYISYRIWVDNKKDIIIENLINEYGDKVLEIFETKNMKLKDNIYLNMDEEFVWPDLNNNYYNELGTCQGLKTHIGILVDGTVTVCCLDSDGKSNLGNIFNETLEEILEKEKCRNVIKNFNNNKCYLEICKHCSYKDKFK